MRLFLLVLCFMSFAASAAVKTVHFNGEQVQVATIESPATILNEEGSPRERIELKTICVSVPTYETGYNYCNFFSETAELLSTSKLRIRNSGCRYVSSCGPFAPAFETQTTAYTRY